MLAKNNYRIKNIYSIFTSNTSYVLLEIFMQFVAAKTKIWRNNKGSSFLRNTV